MNNLDSKLLNIESGIKHLITIKKLYVPVFANNKNKPTNLFCYV